MQLQGNGFILRGWFPGDEASLQRNADNPNVPRFLLDRFPSPYTIEAAEQWVDFWQHQDPIINFAIVINDEIIGGIGLQIREDVYRKTPLLGYWLAEQHWDKGLMVQAVKLVANYAFEQLGAICLLAYVMGKNPASMRVLEKAGFNKIGVVPQSVIKFGEILDEHVYALNRYPAQHLPKERA
jgi:ribosomal-protein-alanine N-acetyltransferase